MWLATVADVAGQSHSEMSVNVFQGVLSAIPLMFIFPAACFLKLSDDRWFRGENLIPSIILAAGVCVMIIGLVMMVLFPQDCSHGAEMFYCTVSNASVPSTTSPSALQFINTTQNASTFWLKSILLESY